MRGQKLYGFEKEKPYKFRGKKGVSLKKLKNRYEILE